MRKLESGSFAIHCGVCGTGGFYHLAFRERQVTPALLVPDHIENNAKGMELRIERLARFVPKNRRAQIVGQPRGIRPRCLTAAEPAGGEFFQFTKNFCSDRKGKPVCKPSSRRRFAALRRERSKVEMEYRFLRVRIGNFRKLARILDLTPVVGQFEIRVPPVGCWYVSLLLRYRGAVCCSPRTPAAASGAGFGGAEPPSDWFAAASAYSCGVQ